MTATVAPPPPQATAADPADPAFAALRAAWHRRFPPYDAAEEAALESLVAALWRRRLLDRLEARVLEALGAGNSLEGMPSLASLARYAARLAKDIELARARFFGLRNLRRGAAEAGEAVGRAAGPHQPPGAKSAARKAPTAALRLGVEPLADLKAVMRELFEPRDRADAQLRGSVSPIALSAQAA